MMEANISFSDGIFGEAEYFRISDFVSDAGAKDHIESAADAISKNIYGNPFFKSVLDSLNIGVNIVGINHKVIYINREQTRIHNIPENRYVGQIIDAITPMSGHIHVLKNGKRFCNDELKISMKHSVTVRTICIPIVDQNGALLGSFGMSKALSDYRETLLELKSARNMLSSFAYIYDDNLTPIAILDVMGKIIYANPAFQDVSDVDVPAREGQSELGSLSHIAKNALSESHGNFVHFIKIQNHEYKVTTLPYAINNEIKGCVCTLRAIKITEKPKPLVIGRDEIEQMQHVKRELSKPFKNIVGENRGLLEQLDIADRAAKTSCSILITGSSGSGKELVANAIHQSSGRAAAPFVAINCGSIPENLIESELFGYEEGAFTGAKKGGKSGKFELANKGTLFLDEIGDMPLVMQVKLLRILNDMENERVGGVKKSKLDVRVLVATNRDLRQMILAGKFREDLFFRLNVVSIHLPSLYERKDDIPLLVNHFIKHYCMKYDKKTSLSDSAMKILKNYHWPGSVRELKNIIENIVVLTNSNYIQPFHLPCYIWNAQSEPVSVKDLPQAKPTVPAGEKSVSLSSLREQAEKSAIQKVLQENNYNKCKAMRALGVSRRTFYNKLYKYNIDMKKPAVPKTNDDKLKGE